MFILVDIVENKTHFTIYLIIALTKWREGLDI
jgi:hypothetical protein